MPSPVAGAFAGFVLPLITGPGTEVGTGGNRRRMRSNLDALEARKEIIVVGRKFLHDGRIFAERHERCFVARPETGGNGGQALLNLFCLLLREIIVD